MKKILKKLTCLLGLVCIMVAQAQASFVIEDILVNGLQRIPVSKVYRSLPFDVGDTMKPELVAQAIHALYETGNFQDVKIERDANQVIITVSERPSISDIEIEGNKAIQTEDLLEGLKQSGLAKGSVFQRATLERVQTELERQYVAQGRYGAQVAAEVVPQPRNRVALKIKIREGEVATIQHINITGNQVFRDEALLDLFQLKVTHLWSFFKGDDKYARERLAGDLEALRSFYMDRGFINFNIESTQVSIDPSKEHVYITINITEGERFSVDQVTLSGHLPVDEKELKDLILVKTGQTFSRKLVVLTEDLISKKLGNVGYTFAQVNGVPDIDQENKNVNVNFFIDPGKRVYVRSIHFQGNEKTADHVMRREMRQMEGAWASGEKIELSKVRLERLGFFKGVKVETARVPGTEDQIDINFSVEEQPSGSIGASVGYQGGVGFVFGANVSQNNFLGTGNQVSFDLQRNDFRNAYNFTFRDPYFTVDGVSRGYSFYFSETDYSDASLSRYRADAYGANVSFGYPINENDRVSFSAGFDNTTIIVPFDSGQEVKDFIDYDCPLEPDDASCGNQSEDFYTYTLSGAWRSSTLNKGVLPDRGALNRLSLEVAIPGSELEYYKLGYQGERYFPLTDTWTLRLRTELGYGDGYGDTERLPFYKHFYAGGVYSVRGYETRSLGPKDTSITPDPFGGNLLVEGSLEFIFPAPFVKDKRTVRTAFFIDGGNVFDTKRDDESKTSELSIDPSELRYSAGFGLTWITAIGPLTFTVSKAFNDSDGDDTQGFDFTLGQTF